MVNDLLELVVKIVHRWGIGKGELFLPRERFANGLWESIGPVDKIKGKNWILEHWIWALPISWKVSWAPDLSGQINERFLHVSPPIAAISLLINISHFFVCKLHSLAFHAAQPSLHPEGWCWNIKMLNFSALPSAQELLLTLARAAGPWHGVNPKDQHHFMCKPRRKRYTEL